MLNWAVFYILNVKQPSYIFIENYQTNEITLNSHLGQNQYSPIQ